MTTLEEFTQTLLWHDNLNIKLFKNDKLKPEIVKQLLKISDVFRIDCNIPPTAVKDVILTGGNANYNYTEISDIDLHLVVDFTKIQSCDLDLVDYYKLKKESWSTNHNITIYGYPVELYAQNVLDPHPSGQGIYSVMHQKWVVYPQKTPPDYEDPKIIDKVDKLSEMINNCNSLKDAKALKDKLKAMRNSGLHKGGEHSVENISWKQLRNAGYITKLDMVYKQLRDRGFSL